MQRVIELPPREQQIALNRARWRAVLADPALAALPFRVETNAYGTLLMTPPPSGEHSRRQTRIVLEFARLLGGQPLVECPISTIDGVRAADIGWYSSDRFAEVRQQAAFEIAPEICVDVVSPSNTPAEMRDKKQLYFEAGAEEVWFCQPDGHVEHYLKDQPDVIRPDSPRCPDFPRDV